MLGEVSDGPQGLIRSKNMMTVEVKLNRGHFFPHFNVIVIRLGGER